MELQEVKMALERRLMELHSSNYKYFDRGRERLIDALEVAIDKLNMEMCTYCYLP